MVNGSLFRSSQRWPPRASLPPCPRFSFLVTSDVDRLLALYVGVFGAEQISRMPEQGEVFYVGLRIGDSEFGLVSEAGVQTGGPVRVGLTIEVPDIGVAMARVEASGGIVLGPPNDMPWGQRVAHAQDPDGTTVNLAQNL